MKRSPLKRKTPLKGGGALKRCRIRSASKKRRSQLTQYSKARKDYFETHAKCEVSGCQNAAMDIHHKAGREGALLCDTQYFMAVCRRHHDWIHTNGRLAEAMGYIVRLYRRHLT